jgi:predicted phosphodiesterase
MRLHVFSDLHLEFGFVSIPTTDADVVVIAGDLHLGREGRKWIRANFPNQPVIYVLGNHEFYRHSLPELKEALVRETEGTNIRVLENESVVVDGFKFLGCTLWTDFALRGNAQEAMQAAEAIMSDYSIIQNSQKNRLLRAKDTAKIHNESRAWLKQEIQHSDRGKTIIVTHHAPSSRSEATYHHDSPLAPAFASDLEPIIEASGIPLWIHGHTHHNVDYKIGRTQVLTNQRGYPDQLCPGFNPDRVIEV